MKRETKAESKEKTMNGYAITIHLRSSDEKINLVHDGIKDLRSTEAHAKADPDCYDYEVFQINDDNSLTKIAKA
jgi:hypothetical protein